MAPWHDADDDDDDSVDEEADDADALDVAELPDPADVDPPGDEAERVRCPFCRRFVYDGADVCPGCHSFLGGSDDPTPRRPAWVVVALVLCLAAMLLTCAIRMW